MNHPRLTDAGNADRLVDLYSDELRYCATAQCWYTWDGRRWHEDTTSRIMQRALSVAASYRDAAEEVDKDSKLHKSLLKHADASENLPRLKAMVAIAQTHPAIATIPEDYDRNPDLMTVANGTIDLRTCAFGSFSPDHLITRIAPVAYNRTARSSLWEGFLETVIPTPAMREFLQRAVGYSMTGHTHHECMFLLHGGGRNGKTTFTGTILNMMGEYGAQASSNALMRKTASGPSNELYVLRGRRFVLASETGEGGRMDEELVKQITGGERVSVNPKYRSQMEITPTWKIWLGTNHEPVIRGNDDAIWSRIYKIPFGVTITRPDPDLKLRLFRNLDDRSGILNWALEGVRMWRQEGLNPPQEVMEAAHAYRSSLDLIGQFLNDRCQRHPSLSVYKHRLYTEYTAYCKSCNEHPKSKQAFGHQLSTRGIRDDRNRCGRYWTGIGIGERVSLSPRDMEKE